MGRKRRVNYRHAGRRRLPGMPFLEGLTGVAIAAAVLVAVLIIFGSPS